jgi:hypothetical protein
MSNDEFVSNDRMLEDSINLAFDDKRRDQARKLIELALTRLPDNWRPIRQTERGTEGAFWDSDEFMAFIADRVPDRDGSTY